MKRFLSSRLFGSTKNVDTSNIDDSSSQLTHDSPSLPPPPSRMAPNSATHNLSDTPLKTGNFPAEITMDNRSVSSRHDDDEYKREIDDHSNEGDTNRLSGMINPAHKMMMVPPDAAKLRKATHDNAPSAPLPAKPAPLNQKISGPIDNPQTNIPLGPSPDMPWKHSEISQESHPTGGSRLRTASEVSDHAPSVTATEPHVNPPNPPAFAIRDASELQAKATRLHHHQSTVPPRSTNLPVQPPDMISHGRSNLKHTSAAQERRMQQQAQQGPTFGRALLKQTSQFDRLVNNPAHGTRSPTGGVRKALPTATPVSGATASRTSAVQSTPIAPPAFTDSGHKQSTPPSGKSIHMPARAQAPPQPQMKRQLVQQHAARLTTVIDRDTSRSATPFDGAHPNGHPIGRSPSDDVSVISSISGASGLVSTHESKTQSQPDNQRHREKQTQSSRKHSTSGLRLPVSAGAPVRSSVSLASTAPSTDPPPLSPELSSKHKQHREQHVVYGRSTSASPNLPPPEGSNVSEGQGVPRPPPAVLLAQSSVPFSQGVGVKNSAKEGRNERHLLSEQEREKLLREEKERWRILPPDPVHKTSKVRRLFHDVGRDNMVTDGGYADSKEMPTNDSGPLNIAAGTLAAELITLIQNARVEGVGKPVEVPRRDPSAGSTTTITPAPLTTESSSSATSSPVQTKKPFQDGAETTIQPKSVSAEEDDELQSIDSADFDEEQYFQLIAQLPGLTEMVGEKECWEMKTKGGPKINVMFGGGTESTHEAAKLIAKAKKHQEKKAMEEKEKILSLNLQSEADLKALSDTLRGHGQQKPQKSECVPMIASLHTLMVPLRVGMDDEWKRNDDAIRLSKLSQDGSKPSRRATGDMSAVDLRFLLAHDKVGAEGSDKYLDVTEISRGKGDENGDRSGQRNGRSSGRPLTFREKVWRRAADHMALSFNTTDPEMQDLKSTAAKQGLDLLEKEFGTYRNRDEWEGLEVFKRNRKQRIAKGSAEPQVVDKPRTASDAVARRLRL